MITFIIQSVYMKKIYTFIVLIFVSLQIANAQATASKPIVFDTPSAIDSVIKQKGNFLKLSQQSEKPIVNVNGKLIPFNVLFKLEPKDIVKLTYYANTKGSPYARIIPNGGSMIFVATKNASNIAQNALQGVPADLSTHQVPVIPYHDDSTPKQTPIAEDVKIFLPSEPELHIASYPGGNEKLDNHIANNLRYPAQAEEKKIQGDVKVSFVVEKDGSLTNIVAETKLGFGLEEEAIRLFKVTRRWNPSIKKGKPVRVKLTHVVKFTLK